MGTHEWRFVHYLVNIIRHVRRFSALHYIRYERSHKIFKTWYVDSSKGRGFAIGKNVSMYKKHFVIDTFRVEETTNRNIKID